MKKSSLVMLLILALMLVSSGLPSTGRTQNALGVYDGNGLFLGYLVQTTLLGAGDIGGFLVFHPEIQAFFYLAGTFSPQFEVLTTDSLAFTSTDCTGQPYVQQSFGSQTLLAASLLGNTTFYLMDTEVPVIRYSDVKSIQNFATNQCVPESNSSTNIVFYGVKQIPKPPLFDTTIVHPLIVKPIPAQIPPTYTLSVNPNPPGGGSITVTPLKSSYNANDLVTLTASTNTGYVFSNWSGDATGTAASIQITMTKNMTVTANFAFTAISYTLTVTPYPIMFGTVTLSPGGGSYSPGTQVTITARSIFGRTTFSGWSDDATGTITGTDNPITITMPSSNLTATANFKLGF